MTADMRLSMDCDAGRMAPGRNSVTGSSSPVMDRRGVNDARRVPESGSGAGAAAPAPSSREALAAVWNARSVRNAERALAQCALAAVRCEACFTMRSRSTACSASPSS